MSTKSKKNKNRGTVVVLQTTDLGFKSKDGGDSLAWAENDDVKTTIVAQEPEPEPEPEPEQADLLSPPPKRPVSTFFNLSRNMIGTAIQNDDQQSKTDPLPKTDPPKPAFTRDMIGTAGVSGGFSGGFRPPLQSNKPQNALVFTRDKIGTHCKS